MKAAFFAVLLAASSMSHAAPVHGALGAEVSLAAALNAPVAFETKGRTGSKRVGGSGRSGKGGRYVGGHK